MGRESLVSIVVITWNSAEYLQRCLDGVERQTYPSRELIVVDNASSDDSLAIAGSRASKTIRNDTNRGFAAAANQGTISSEVGRPTVRWSIANVPMIASSELRIGVDQHDRNPCCSGSWRKSPHIGSVAISTE